MKAYRQPYTALFFIIMAINSISALAESTLAQINTLPSSAIQQLETKSLPHNALLLCKASSGVDKKKILQPKSQIKSNKSDSVSYQYLNKSVTMAYSTMHNEVFKHVARKVTLSLLSFSRNSLAPETIATHISNGTQAFLPFRFANNVQITQVSTQGRIVIYKTVMPIDRNHTQASALAIAGRNSTMSRLCNNPKMVNDLLKQNLIIQYDYYDSNGDFFSSFSINS